MPIHRGNERKLNGEAARKKNLADRRKAAANKVNRRGRKVKKK